MFYLVQCFKTISLTHIYTKLFEFQFTIFTSCIFTLLYISTYNLSCHLISQLTKNDFIYLQSFDDTYLDLLFLSHLILTRMSWLQPRKSGMYFILSDNNIYDFDVKVKCYRFMSFVNDVIVCMCLECVFCFRIKEKEKDTFYINFYFTIFLKSCFLFLIT